MESGGKVSRKEIRRETFYRFLRECDTIYLLLSFNLVGGKRKKKDYRGERCKKCRKLKSFLRKSGSNLSQ